MQFLREDKAAAIEAITLRLQSELAAKKRVLWLVCGGSNIEAEAAVMKRLNAESADLLGGLAILPTDERFGPVGHADSNYRQLQQAGFEPGTATWVDVLLHDVPLAETVSFYNDVAATAFANASVIIGVFGMGANAHIAGMQPGSPAVAAGYPSVVGYPWEDFTRLTLTAEKLKHIQTAYVLVYGDKHEALVRLQRNEEDFEQMPAKVLYDIPEVYIYNETVESKG